MTEKKTIFSDIKNEVSGLKKTQGATVANLMKYIAPVVLVEYTMDGKRYRGQVKKAFKDTKFCEAMKRSLPQTFQEPTNNLEVGLAR